MTNPDLPRDPLNLEAVDREIRINELEERLTSLGMGSMGVSDDCPPEAHEEFLSGVEAYESAPIGRQFDELIKAGIELPDPEALDDAALHAKLWQVIHALAARSVYLSHTDHLSDRELYQDLWSDLLREENPIMPAGSGWRNYLDILGGCSEEDIKISQRYYDDEETRAHWAKDFPEDVIPPHEDPPYDRDRLLPQPPEPPRMEWDECDDDCECDDWDDEE